MILLTMWVTMGVMYLQDCIALSADFNTVLNNIQL